MTTRVVFHISIRFIPRAICLIAAWVMLHGDARSAEVITLDEAVRRALTDNVGLAIERITPDISATTIDEAKAGFDPSSTLRADYGESSSPRTSEQQAADGRSSSESRQFSTEAGVNQKIVTGTEVGLSARTRNTQSTFNRFQDEYESFAGLTFRHPLLKNAGPSAQLFPIRSAENRTEAEVLLFRQKMENLIRDVHLTYYELLSALATHEARSKAVATAERLMVDNQNRYELGVMTPLDVAQARSEVSQRMSALLQAELDIKTRQISLKRLMERDFGDRAQDPVLPVEEMPEPESLPEPEYNIAAGLYERPDLQALLKQADQSGLEVTFRKNQIFPQLDLTGRVGLQGRDQEFEKSVENIIETRDEVWGVGVAVSIPWGNRAERARLKRSRLEEDRLLLQIKNKEHEIIEEIINAHRTAENARLRHLNDRQARMISERTAEAEEERLKEGISTSFTVLQLQRDATEARTREVSSLLQYYRALVELRRAQGLLLKDHNLVWKPEPAL